MTDDLDTDHDVELWAVRGFGDCVWLYEAKPRMTRRRWWPANGKRVDVSLRAARAMGIPRIEYTDPPVRVTVTVEVP